MSDFARSHLIRAALKKHVCEQCGTKVEAGQSYWRFTGRYDGSFYCSAVHPECQEAAIQYLREVLTGGSDEYPWFQHDESFWEDWDWMCANHPLVAKRLGWDERLAEWKDAS